MNYHSPLTNGDVHIFLYVDKDHVKKKSWQFEKLFSIFISIIIFYAYTTFLSMNYNYP